MVDSLLELLDEHPETLIIRIIAGKLVGIDDDFEDVVLHLLMFASEDFGNGLRCFHRSPIKRAAEDFMPFAIDFN